MEKPKTAQIEQNTEGKKKVDPVEKPSSQRGNGSQIGSESEAGDGSQTDVSLAEDDSQAGDVNPADVGQTGDGSQADVSWKY